LIASLEDYVCLPPESAVLSEVKIRASSYTNAVDEFLKAHLSISRAGIPSNMTSIESLTAMLIVRCVSSTENYFRTILSEMLEMCPIAQRDCAEQQINLGGLIWHGKNRFSRSAFEHVSFADSSEIVKATKKFIGCDLDRRTFSDIFPQFDKLCQLRHAIVHADCHIPGRNAVKLNIVSIDSYAVLDLSYENLQDTLLVVRTLVSTYNRFMFTQFCQRWAVGWRQQSSWLPKDDYPVFKRMWRAFFSEMEFSGRPDRSRFTVRRCYNAVTKEYDLQ
jgi:hypothetical protein